MARSSRPGSRRRRFYKGISVVPGIAIGRVHIKFRQTQAFSDRTIEPSEVQRELDRFREAVRVAKEQLMVARNKVADEIGELEAMIFDSHIAILEDHGFLDKVRKEVEQELKPVEVVVSVIVEGYYKALSMVDDEHLRERAADIRDVGVRLLDNLQQFHTGGDAVGTIPEGDILFARELLPSDIPAIESAKVTGVVTEAGSGRGHVAVMLRAMGIPCVMGVDGIAEQLHDGDQLIVDGSAGSVFIEPRADVLASYRETLIDYEAYRKELRSEAGRAAGTRDGIHIRMMCNIGKRSEVRLGKMYQMEGVGLYRTEFPLMVRNSFPDEDDQFRNYRELLDDLDGQPLTIRTMDIGSDKQLSYLRLPLEENAALGKRSIRLLVDLEEYQMIQLRAILRASAHGDVRLLFPFITSIEDIRLAKRMVRHARRQLDDAGKKYASDLQIGMMVEIPAAALSLDKFAREVQFFSVGTNDLVQYVCAADRNLPEVAPWYKGYNPGVLHLLRQTVEQAKKHKRPLTICGEMAGDPLYTMFLVGIGVTELSMSPPQIPLVKKIVRSIDMAGARRLVDRAFELSSTSQIRDLFRTTVETMVGHDLSYWTKT